MTRAQPLSLRIGGWMRRQILDVRLPPGAPIVEAAIAQRFGASRTPVREALLRLADEGLVDIRPQRGTYVARLVLSRIAEALFVREAVECAVLARLASRPDHAALARRLGAIVDGHEAALDARDDAAGFAADERFHRELVQAAGLPGVWDVVARAREMHQRIRAIAVPELGSARAAVAGHRAVVRALAAGRADAAQTAMTRHLARNLALAQAIARRHPDYFADVDAADVAA
jgi:DNA-binding GntR family transcriptional regulator